MNPNRPSSEDEGLRKLLRSWSVAEPLAPRFEAGVWKRILRAELERPASLWQSFAHFIETALSSRGPALGYVSILLFAGVAGGYLHARSKSAESEEAMRARYVQSVDPYQAPRNHSR